MVRFLADANLRHAIVTGCLRREPAIDFLSARAAKLEGLSDLDVLTLAAAQSRIPALDRAGLSREIVDDFEARSHVPFCDAETVREKER